MPQDTVYGTASEARKMIDGNESIEIPARRPAMSPPRMSAGAEHMGRDETLSARHVGTSLMSTGCLDFTYHWQSNVQA